MTQRDNKIGIGRDDDMVVTHHDSKAVARDKDFCLISVSTDTYRLDNGRPRPPQKLQRVRILT